MGIYINQHFVHSIKLPVFKLIRHSIFVYYCLMLYLLYFRAKITGLKGQKADVYYLDFGNSESLPVTELFELPKELILHPGFSMKVGF